MQDHWHRRAISCSNLEKLDIVMVFVFDSSSSLTYMWSIALEAMLPLAWIMSDLNVSPMSLAFSSASRLSATFLFGKHNHELILK